jgi:hypothetical protein
MASHHQFFAIVNMVLFGLEMAGVLIIVWMGWLRARRFAYLILAAWALANIVGMVASSVALPLIQTRWGTPGGQAVGLQVYMWMNIARTLVTSVLLLVGLGLLVRGEARPVAQP